MSSKHVCWDVGLLLSILAVAAAAAAAVAVLLPLHTMEGCPDLGVPDEEAEVELPHIPVIVAEGVGVLLQVSCCHPHAQA
jgi:hypothetical protein